jgi:histone demethylase JARID1
MGEAVNFATHDWIAYGSDANERYRSFARPAVFSHDRLTFTMANHLVEQNSYSTCKLLLDELERVVEEELRLRKTLAESGVRDVSSYITLPKNRLDQLDENSANYDDKRLCHACKHVCFFSAVACECSQSKVSCLRHSHYMCRCPTDRKYFMLWSNEKELTSTLGRVRDHCSALKTQTDEVELAKATKASQDPLPDMAPGAEQDAALHKGDEIPTELLLFESHRAPRRPNAKDGKPALPAKVAPMPEPEPSARKVSTSSLSVEASSAVDETAFAHAEEEIEIVTVRGPTV